jgi:hypothetical protein
MAEGADRRCQVASESSRTLSMAQHDPDNTWEKPLSSLLWKIALVLVLAPWAIGFFFALLFGPDEAYSLPDFLIMWFFVSFAFMTNAMAVAGILENAGLIKAPAGTETGPAGTVFYISLAAFLNYILLKEMGFLG